MKILDNCLFSWVFASTFLIHALIETDNANLKRISHKTFSSNLVEILTATIPKMISEENITVTMILKSYSILI